MKTLSLRYLAPALIASVALFTAGCKKCPTSGAAFKTSGSSASAAAETNSFDEVAAFLEPGGSFYLFLDTQQWLDGLSTKIDDLRQVLTSLPNMPATDRENLRKLIGIVSGLVQASGLEEVSGFGASGILAEKGMYRNRFVLHHYPGRNQGLLWSLFGKEPHTLTGLDLLPDATALASFSDVDLGTFWKTLQAQVEQANMPELSKGLEQLSAGLESKLGINLDQIAASLGGEVGFVLTLDNDKLVTLPAPNGGRLEFPEPALALVFKVTDDKLFARFDALLLNILPAWLQNNKQVVREDKGNLKLRSVPMPFLFPVRPTLAYNGEYLFLATSDKLVQKMLDVKGGGKGLKSNAEFARISKGIPLQGNRFTYVSPEISRTIGHLIGSVAFMQEQAGKTDGGAELLQRLFGEDQESFSFSVASNTKEGWVGMGHSSRHPVTSLLGPSVVPLAIAAGVALPALAKAKQRAQTISCISNIKQIGLAARIYANDHGDVLPSDFASMKAELNTPRILICPGDPSKAGGNDWKTFNFAEASYEMVSPGAKTSDAQKVFVRCRIHGSVGLVDGSAQQRPGTQNR